MNKKSQKCHTYKNCFRGKKYFENDDTSKMLINIYYLYSYTLELKSYEPLFVVQKYIMKKMPQK